MVVSEISDISKLEDKIEIYFENNKDILKTAFIHSSYANEHKNCENNERLEFLGDAVLGLVIAEYCYKKFPGSEGELTEKNIFCEKNKACTGGRSNGPGKISPSWGRGKRKY